MNNLECSFQQVEFATVAATLIEMNKSFIVKKLHLFPWVDAQFLYGGQICFKSFPFGQVVLFFLMFDIFAQNPF